MRALAYLSNSAALRASHDHSTPDIDDAYAVYTWQKERERFWELLRTFENPDVRWYGFRYVGGRDAWKAAAYAVTDDVRLRLAILENTSEWEVQTLRLGIKDADEQCREAAQDKYQFTREDRKIASKAGRGGRVAEYVWTAAIDLVVLFVVLLLFSKVHTAFERLVVALLVYVHLKVTAGFSRLTLLHLIEANALAHELRHLRTPLGPKLSTDERDEQESEKRKSEQALATETVKVHIHEVFQILMWIAVVYNIVDAAF